MGLTLDEGKQILARLQQQNGAAASPAVCQSTTSLPRNAVRKRGHKGKHQLVWRSLFGKLRLESPRFYHCRFEPGNDGASAHWPSFCLKEARLNCFIWRANGRRLFLMA